MILLLCLKERTAKCMGSNPSYSSIKGKKALFFCGPIRPPFPAPPFPRELKRNKLLDLFLWFHFITQGLCCLSQSMSNCDHVWVYCILWRMHITSLPPCPFEVKNLKYQVTSNSLFGCLRHPMLAPAFDPRGRGKVKVRNVKCSEWQVFWMTPVRNDKYLEWQVFGMTRVQNDRC